MNDISYHTPKDVPSEFLAYDGTIRQLGVGKAGKSGLLKLVLTRKGEKTLIKENISEPPLHLQKALHYEEGFSAIAYLYLASSSGGILQGDRYRMDVLMEENSIAHITTQGASRIYSMNCNFATQIINIALEKNSYLEFIPDQIIPYADSRYYQKVSLEIDDSATLVYSEIITPGRVAMGELFAYDICYLRTQAKNQDRLVLFSDVVKIEPKKQNLSMFGILGKNKTVGTIYILTKKDSGEIKKRIRLYLQKDGKIDSGYSMLPRNSGIIVRLLGQNTEDIKSAIFEIAKITRMIAIDAPFSAVRKA